MATWSGAASFGGDWGDAIAAPLPPDLVVLEQKMARLQVKSERFSQVSSGTIKVTNESNGKPVGRSKRYSLDATAMGEGSLASNEGEISIESSSGRSKEVVIGSTVFTYSRKVARLDGGRPWVRARVPGATVLPYQRSVDEADAGGTGPYAELINLLTTAVGEVAEVGPVSVDGQQATEFQAAVDPLELIRGLTQEDLQRIEKHPLVEHLSVYLTESGLPVRVVTRQHLAGANSLSSVSTTDIIALEVPVVIKAPPRGRTISQAALAKVEKRHGGDSSARSVSVTIKSR